MKTKKDSEFEELKFRLRQFAKDRDWEKFHSPKNLILALSGEVGELAEIFQWLSEEQAKNLNQEYIQDASNELADIMIYLFRLFDVLNIDPLKAVNEKISLNEAKYPIELSKGNAIKYNKREE